MRFLVWSNEHAMWWRGNQRGYTQYIEEAGRYDRAEADHYDTVCDDRPYCQIAEHHADES